MYYTGMVFYGTNMFIIIVIAIKSDGGSFNERPNNNCALAYCAESATHHNNRSIVGSTEPGVNCMWMVVIR